MRRLTVLALTAWVGVSCADARAQERPSRPAATIAVVSPASAEGTPGAGKSPLAEMLSGTGEKFTDVTDAVGSGKLDFAGARVLMIGSGVLGRDGDVRAKVLTEGRTLVTDFVTAGGVVVVFAQPSRAGLLQWLPSGVSADVFPETHDRRTACLPDHPLVAGRHRLTPADLGSRTGVLYPGNCFGRYRGLVPVVAYDQRGRYPLILEGSVGAGRVLLVHLSPDLALLGGTADEKVSARLLVDNLVGYLRQVLAGKAPEVKPVERTLTGVVFEDVNANGKRDPGERPLAGIHFSDDHRPLDAARGGEPVEPLPVDPAGPPVTDAEGVYVLSLDAYSRFVQVLPDVATYQGPYWRRTPEGVGRLDVGLVPRRTPLGANPRIVYLCDTGCLVDPASKTDPELAFMLGEISLLDPKPDVLVYRGDSRAAEVRAEVIRKHLPEVEVISWHDRSSEAADRIAAEDAFANAFGPSPLVFRLHDWRLGLDAAQTARMLGPAEDHPSFRRGGLTTPPGFDVVDVAAGTVRVQRRIAGLGRFLRPIHPALEAAVTPGPLQVAFALGDTALGSDIPVKVEMAHIRRKDDRLELVELQLPPYRLASRGRFTREVVFDEPVPLAEGYYIMRFAADAPRTDWTRNVSFVVPKTALPERVFGRPWTVVGGNDFHTGEVLDKVEPPFALVSVQSLGSRVLGGSPLVLPDSVLVRCEKVRADMSAAAAGAVTGIDGPFFWHGQGLFRLVPGEVRLTSTEPAGTFVFAFEGDPPRAETTHLLVGGEFLCVVDARGSAWGFLRTRGAPLADDQYDRKAAVDSLKWKVDVTPGCRQAVATDSELFTARERLEIGTGTVRWRLDRHDLRDASVTLVPLKESRVVITGVTSTESPRRQMLLVVDRETGKVLWEKVLAEVHPLDGVMTPPASVAHGAVFVGSADGVFRSFRLTDGQELWRFGTGPSVIPLSARDDRRGARITAQAVVTDQHVTFAAADGRLYALDRRSGTPKWFTDLGLPVTASCALSGNTLVVADWDGNVYTFVSLERKK